MKPSRRDLKIVTRRPLSALVARVSGQRAAKEGYSLDAQVPMLKQFAEREGYGTEDRYILFDDGYQGDDWDRPAINKALALAQAGDVQAVTFLNTDRFARDVMGGRKMVAKLVAAGAAVIFGDLGRVRDDANFMLLLNFKLSLAEYEKAMIRTRSMWGTEQKIKDGEVICSRPIYGYERWEDNLRIVDAEAKIVRLIYRLYEQGESMRAIVRRLKADEVIPPGATRRNKGNWNATTIREILNDRTYIGEWHYGKTQCVAPKVRRSTKEIHRPKSSKRQMPQSEWKMVPVPGIIDKPLFDLVQAKMKANVHILGGRPSRAYELKGLLFCGRCDRPYLGNSSRGVRYRCSNRDQDTGATTCPSESVRADLIEPVIYAAVEEIFTNRAVLEEAIGRLQKSSGSQAQRDSLIARSEELRRIEFKARREKLHAADDPETEKLYAQEIKELMAQRAQIQRQVDSIMPAINGIDASAIVAAAQKAFATTDRGKRQEILRRAVRRIVYDDREKTVEIQVAIPISKANNCKSRLGEIDSYLLIPIKRRVA